MFSRPLSCSHPDESKNAKRPVGASAYFEAPRVGFEPTTNSLTASCATAALPGNAL